MNERQAFIQSIAANLYEDTPRLAFADWLDEHGEHDRAEFIRVQCELEPIRDQYELPRAAELHKREEYFGSRGTYQHDSARQWLGAMPEGWDGWHKGISIEYRRGFPDILALPARMFLDVGAEIRKLHPTIRRVVLFRVNEYGERVASCEVLEGLAELELACWYSNADAWAITNSPYLSKLQVLELWLGRAAPLRDSPLCRMMAGAKAWPTLRQLTLLNPDGQKMSSRKRLLATANKSAGRNVAVYQRGYPELFPFAPGNRVGEPGRLPDGRLALAALSDEEPFVYEVITFDVNGKQTEEVIRIPLPMELAVQRGFRFQSSERFRCFLWDLAA